MTVVLGSDFVSLWVGREEQTGEERGKGKGKGGGAHANVKA